MRELVPDQTLENTLQDDIIFGRFATGVRLVEERIMQDYGAKRHVVRAAFAALELQGLLVRKPNRGVEIAEFTPDEVDTLYDVRIILETAAAARTQLPCPKPVLDQMSDIARAHETAAIQSDFRKVYRLNQQFHELQYSCCGNPRLAKMIGDHARMAQPIRVVKYDDADHMQNIVRQHFAIIEAMTGTSHDALIAAVQAHLPASAEAYRSMFEKRRGLVST